MTAYVALRGSRSTKVVTRSASPAPLAHPRVGYPFAALEIGHPDGSSTGFELSYAMNQGGEPVVEVTRRSPGRQAVTLLKEVVSIAILAAFLSLPSFAAEPCKVNVNAATPAELQLLARTGEVLSSRIVAGRPLDAEKLDAVKGVGEAWLAVNGPHVAYSGPTTCTEKIKAAPKVAAKTAPKVAAKTAPKVAAQSPKL